MHRVLAPARVALIAGLHYYPHRLQAHFDAGMRAGPPQFFYSLNRYRMLLDHEVSNCSRTCAVSGRTLAPGEAYFSTLHVERGATVRKDFCAAEWRGPMAGAIAWWQARVPDGDPAKPKLAPHDVLLNLFAELAERPHEMEFRYVLGLLLMRRRILKFEETRRDDLGEVMILDCPARNEQYELRVATPAVERTEQLEQRMIELLYGGE